MDEPQGWICLWRQLLKSDIWKCDGELLKVFIWCLLKATHQPLETNKMIVERGQFIAGEKVAAKELGIPASTYRGKLKKLKELGVIETKVANRFTLITVCNYSTYQNVDLPQPVNQATIYKDNTMDNNNTTVLAESPVVKRKTKAKPREETKPLITYYTNKYKEIFSEPYHISWAKDSSCIKRLLDGGFTADRLFKLIDMFLNDKDSFLDKTGHTISMFSSRINRYVEQLQSEPPETAPLSGWNPKPEEKTIEQRHKEAEEQIENIIEYNRCFPEPKEECGKRLKLLTYRVTLTLRCKEIGDIPDDLWCAIYPNNAKNPHRKH